MRSARLALALLLTTSLGCTQKDWIDRTLVTEDVTGLWAGSMDVSPFRPEVRLELRQQGAKVTGVMKVPTTGSYSLGSGLPVEESVAGRPAKIDLRRVDPSVPPR